MTVGKRKDPYLNCNFLVEIDGIIAAGFSDVSGMDATVQVEEYREGGLNTYVHKLPKETRYSNLILKRGLTDSAELWKWHYNVVMGKIERKNGSIVLLDGIRTEKWRINFVKAYPVKWTGPDFKSGGSALAIETLELAHNGLFKA